MIDILLKAEDLKVSFYNENSSIQVVRGFDLEIIRGEIVGIVGESGSGKTVSASSLIGLINKDIASIDSGSVLFEDKDLVKLSEKEPPLVAITASIRWNFHPIWACNGQEKRMNPFWVEHNSL